MGLALVIGACTPMTPPAAPETTAPEPTAVVVAQATVTPAPSVALTRQAPAVATTTTPTDTPFPTATPAPTRTREQPTISPTATLTATSTAVAALDACKAPLTLTPSQTEGPMYLANPPQRSNFRGDAANAGGEPITLVGRVLSPDCKPVADARVDVWHTDARGDYDMTQTYTSRGYVLTDREGRFRFETILPAIYTGRTAHIHVKITPPGGQTLTTQLYFPNAATNAGDAIFDARLLVRLDETPGGKRATYDFVVKP
jgi:protocatechuate 3,4-dioxygenase beta subunit